MFEIKGKWFNTKTNESVYPRECLQEDGRMYILFMDGQRMLMEDFQNSYVQISDESYNENMDIIKESNSQNINNETNDLLSKPIVSVKEFMFDDIEIINTKDVKDVKNNMIKSPHYDIINKAFEKQGYKYNYEFKSTSVYPKKIHEFLRDFTDVQDEEIVTYIIDKFLDYESVKNVAIKEVKRLFNIGDKIPEV